MNLNKKTCLNKDICWKNYEFIWSVFVEKMYFPADDESNQSNIKIQYLRISTHMHVEYLLAGEIGICKGKEIIHCLFSSFIQNEPKK